MLKDYCNNTGEDSGTGQTGKMEGEIPEPMGLYHEKIKFKKCLKCKAGSTQHSIIHPIFARANGIHLMAAVMCGSAMGDVFTLSGNSEM